MISVFVWQTRAPKMEWLAPDAGNTATVSNKEIYVP